MLQSRTRRSRRGSPIYPPRRLCLPAAGVHDWLVSQGKQARTHSTSTSRSCRQPATLPTCDKRSSSKHRARLMLERGRIEVGEEAARGRRGGGLSGLLGCLHGGPRRHAARVQAAAAAAVGSAGPARGWSKYVTSPHREAGVSPCGWRREHGYNCRRSERAARQGSACKSGR